MLPSSKTTIAVLQTAYRGLVFLRNYTHRPDADLKCINQLAEALHDIPSSTTAVERFAGGETQLISMIRLHLSGFDHRRWPGSPNLVALFDDELSRA